MATSPQQRKGGPIKRIADVDFSTAEAVLKAAMTLIVPDELSQRQAFKRLVPYLYVLRNKGCSWSQLTQLVNDCGFDLQPASVRTYYGEMLSERQDQCQERMNDQILLLAEVRKVTKGAEVSDMTERAVAIMEKHKAAAASKIDTLLGGSSATSVAQASAETVTPVLTENKNSGLRPSPLSTPPESNSKNTASPTITLRCLPLKDGVEPLKPRPNVDPEAYLPGDLEHPKIPGLLLSLDDRIYSAALEYADANGEVKLETLDEKRFRIRWTRPIPMTPTMTGDGFTKMDMSLFKKP